MTVEFYKRCLRYARGKSHWNSADDIASEMYLLFAESGGKATNLSWLFVDALRKDTKWSRQHKLSKDPLRLARSVVAGEDGQASDIFETLLPPDPDEGNLALDAGTVQAMCTKLRRLRRLERAVQSGELRSKSHWDDPEPTPALPPSKPLEPAPEPANIFGTGFKLCL